MEKIKNSVIIVLIMILTMIIFIPKSKAAGLTISFSKSNANVGDKINVTVNGNGIAGKISLSVSGNASLSQNSVWVDNSSSTVTATITGEGKVTITATPVDASDSTTANPYTSATSGTITVSSTSTTGNTNNGSGEDTQANSKSNNASLSNLGIRPNDFSGFSPTKTSYSVTVPNEVESVEVYATKGQSGQTVSGTGTKKLAEGANTVNVTVTAEDGKTTKTYTINITRSIADDEEEKEDEEDEDTEEEKQEETENTEEGFGLKELIIEGLDLQPQFQSDIYEYKIELKEDLAKLDLSALATEEDANIEITGNENLQEGENVITIIVKSKDEEKTIAYQIIVNKVLNVEENTSNQEQQKKIIIMAAIGGVVLIIIVVIVVVVVKKRKKGNDSSIPYFNLLDNPDLEEINNLYQENNVEDEIYEEQPKKKKHSKGKRFK